MKSDAERCAEYEKFKKIDAAFRAGDLAALRAAVDDPAVVPNGPMPLTIGACLEYAIYHFLCRLSARCSRSAPIPILPVMRDFHP
jgi:hypothetical protein